MSWQKLTNEQLENLPTHRLLEVYKRQRTWTMSARGPVCSCGEGYNCFEGEPWTDEQLALRAERKVRLDFIKSILDERGHVDTGTVEVTVSKKCDNSSGSFVVDWLSQSDSEWARRKKARDELSAFVEAAVGQQVYKTSGKPFKSKLTYNTVSGVTTNPHSKRVAFTFEEDDSIVDAHVCQLRNKKA